MNTENTWANAAITPSAIEAVVRHARAERAEAMRVALVQLPALIKRLAAAIRPNRQRLPQTSALA